MADDDLPPIIAWCSRHGEVVFFLALLLPVLMEGCAILAAGRREAVAAAGVSADR
jgi:hypothetical protein